jgi:glycosyltransferase involved in cell wall biosynthesis
MPDIILSEMIKSFFYRIVYKFKMHVSAQANRLIFNSHATKNDFFDYYKIDTNNFSVIYLGSEFENNIKQKARIVNSLPGDYIFYMGGFNDRKNVPTLINAFLNISAKYPQLKLIIAGKPNPAQSLKLKSKCGVHVFNNPKIIWKGFVADSDIPELFINAKFFIYPSLYEGFGLPLLDAMKLGTPIITTSLGSISEVTGNAALYLNNTSVSDLTEKMYMLIEDKDLRNKLVIQGKLQASNFSWKKTAYETLMVYNQIFKDENRD